MINFAKQVKGLPPGLIVETPLPGRYALEASTDLKSWQSLQVVTNWGTGAQEVKTPIVELQRFYRVMFPGP